MALQLVWELMCSLPNGRMTQPVKATAVKVDVLHWSLSEAQVAVAENPPLQGVLCFPLND